MWETVNMIKKIEILIKNKSYEKAGELTQSELNKKFYFNRKKDRARYLELQTYKRRVITLLFRTKKEGRGRKGFGSESIIIDEQKMYEERFKKLLKIAKTENKEYQEILRILNYAIEEKNSIIMLLGESGVAQESSGSLPCTA